jgi:hypothetical protein
VALESIGANERVLADIDQGAKTPRKLAIIVAMNNLVGHAAIEN